jgi:methionine aminopeptidase
MQTKKDTPMTSIQATELAAYEAKHAREQAVQKMQEAINHLQCTHYEMDRYLERMEESATNRERAQILNWSINHLVCNIMPNLRIDLLANSQAALAKSEF